MGYDKPQVVDYGTLRDLTAQKGVAVVDVPTGTPAGVPGGVVGPS
ncbi:MAG: hypothetical protein QOJ21_2994 [Solirubrobacteraceae bacterium]|jgi:hypothetical protein|nr:hypothetical protein [Solirubrobacteraceae bacterium]